MLDTQTKLLERGQLSLLSLRGL